MPTIAAIQTIAALATVWIAYLAWRTSIRSTQATAQAAQATEQATVAADTSARAAETLRRIENERRHDELRPRVSLTFKQEPNRALGRSDLFALVANTGGRGYRHKAAIWWPVADPSMSAPGAVSRQDRARVCHQLGQ
jgi:hypothetical protein